MYVGCATDHHNWHVILLQRISLMGPRAAAKKLSKFDPKTFLSTIDGGRKIVAFPKKQTIFVQGDSSDAVFYIQKGKVKLTVVSKSREGSHNRHSERGRFLRRRLPYRAASPPVLRNRNDRLLRDANRQEVHDGSASPGTRVFRHVRGIFAEHGTSDTKRIWLTSFSIPARRDWLGFCCCWLISARKASTRLQSPISVRRPSQR